MSVPQSAFRFDVRPMSQADVVRAADLSRAVSWPHRPEDWRLVLSLGEGLCAYSGGELVGTAMWWTFGKRQTRLGMVIVDPAIQRAGIGRSLMNAVLDQATTPSLLLNATKAGEPLYRKLGFKAIGGIAQHQGFCNAAPLVELPTGMRIRPIGRNDLPGLISLDQAAFGESRDTLIQRLVEEGEAVLLVEGERTLGFACYRRFGRGYVIGPVIAPDQQGAKALIAYWAGTHAGAFQRIDVTAQSGLSSWLESFGFAPAGEVVTMLRGAQLPDTAGPTIFAVANQALG